MEVTANYDETWKEAITEYFDSFLQFFYPEIYAKVDWNKTPISLDKELEQITAAAETPKRHADKLFQVWLKDEQILWILIHVEVQSQYDKDFSQRMFIYNYRAFDLYHQPVISLAILGDESKTWRPSSYQYGLGNSQLIFNFSIVKLLDYEWEDLERSQNVFAIVVMAHLKTKETTSNLSEREQWKWNLVRSLYARGLRKFDIVKLFKFIDKMMSLTPQLQFKFVNQLHQYEQEQQMPFLSTLEEMAIERTAKSTHQKNIIQLLQKRFSKLPESLVENINKIDDVAVLESLVVETIGVNSPEDFQRLIDSQSGDNV
jgi:hypothetical protein